MKTQINQQSIIHFTYWRSWYWHSEVIYIYKEVVLLTIFQGSRQKRVFFFKRQQDLITVSVVYFEVLPLIPISPAQWRRCWWRRSSQVPLFLQVPWDRSNHWNLLCLWEFVDTFENSTVTKKKKVTLVNDNTQITLWLLLRCRPSSSAVG